MARKMTNVPNTCKGQFIHVVILIAHLNVQLCPEVD